MPFEIKKDNKVITIKILHFYLELGCVAIFGSSIFTIMTW